MSVTKKDFENVICQRLRDYRKEHINLFYMNIHPMNEVIHVPNGMGEVVLRDGTILTHKSFSQMINVKHIISDFIFVEHCILEK